MKPLKERHSASRIKSRAAHFEEECIEASATIDWSALPQDPFSDCTNDDRSDFAKSALLTFAKETGSDLETIVQDLITDLAHFCDRHGLSLSDQIENGLWMYGEETDGKGKQSA